MDKKINSPELFDSKFQQRLSENGKSLWEKYHLLYAKCQGVTSEELEAYFHNLIEIARTAFHNRSTALKTLDIQRREQGDWFLSQEIIAMSFYIDLFAQDLSSVKAKISYFKDLGINYLHFMPLLKTRAGEDDGGYAVSSFTEINPRLGNMAQFRELTALLREEGIITCIDFILNHVAKEHEWAQRARRGEKKYQDIFLMYDTDEIPQEFEKSLPSIFPELAPGNFSYDEELHKWVFTTFNEFQWDLNYRNPFTLNKIAEGIFYLINQGVDVIRLDALRHIWKELGTDCSALPETYLITDILKLITYIVAPGVIFKGEAITDHQNVQKYFGGATSGCQIMYNVTLMTALWNSLCTQDVQYLNHCVKNSPLLPKEACWNNYIRCHDDITWVFEEELLAELAINPQVQEQLLMLFYQGSFPGSFAQGEFYSYNQETKSARIAGRLASLTGLEKAQAASNEVLIELSCHRILLLYGVLLAQDGIPLIYSGDEIATLNDYSYQVDEKKAHDSRWIHRGIFDWEKAQRRDNLTLAEGIIFQNLKKLITLRKANSIFRSDIRTEVLDTGNARVFGAFKCHDNMRFLLLANFSEDYQRVAATNLKKVGFNSLMHDLIHEQVLDPNRGAIKLKPYQFFWLK